MLIFQDFILIFNILLLLNFFFIQAIINLYKIKDNSIHFTLQIINLEFI